MQVQNSSTLNTEAKTENSPLEILQKWIAEKLAEQLSVDKSTIEFTEPLTRYGLDSIDAVTLVGELEDELELELPSTLFWDYPTIEKSAEYLVSEFDISEALENLASSEEKTEEVEKTAEKSGKGWGGFWKGVSGS
ncbi:MAG: acyl carrier protein [Okeania sp. SIO2C9]|uniref:acyl carrier protein n=1 Tax=Okeania sp. SIO2C9 TaxID=2607791 RepID=UPI0013BF29F4|nr:acyl carrier protein [Okeania sp. SIO2C9]NEQ74505.1 acyl carrier protein [Okeania sp. SIO2C9]